jgi:hypothetical protein
MAQITSVSIPPNLSLIPTELVGVIGDYLSVPQLVGLSRVNQRIRRIVLNILVQKLELDLPSGAPLGLGLKVTVLNLRQFFRLSAKSNLVNLPSLKLLLGYQPDLTKSPIKMYQAIALRHRGLFHYTLSHCRQEMPPSFTSSDLNNFIKEAYEKACQAQHLRIALELLQFLKSKGYFLHPSNEFLVSAVRSGNLDIVQKVEEMTDPGTLARQYDESAEIILKEACRSSNIGIIGHVSKKLRKPLSLQSDVVTLAYNTGIPNIINPVLSLASAESAPAILKGAYLSRNIPSIQDCIKRLDLQLADPKELSYACSTGDPKIVEFALTRIDRTRCDIAEASKQACIFYNLFTFTLLVKNQLFDLEVDYLSYLETLFKKAQDKGELEELLNVIDSLSNNSYIVSTTLYVKAKERSKIDNFKKNQAERRAQVLLEQQLLQAIKKGSLEKVKNIAPQDAPIPLEVIDSIRLPLLFSATSEWGSKEHLDILLSLMGKGFKIVKDDHQPLNEHQIPPALQDIERFFLQACRHGHLTAAKACLLELSRLPQADNHLIHVRKAEHQEAAILSGEPVMIQLMQELQKITSLRELPSVIKKIEKPTLFKRLQLAWTIILTFFANLWNFLRNLIH